MSRLYGDNGLQAQAIMSLIFVQATLDREGFSDGVTLPENFPDEWKQLVPSRHSDHMTETTFELNLSTSKIQRSVSSALKRIGFEHVEEHVITMEEMANVYDINVPATQLEILSIDIASLADKIAIEVDGPAHFINTIDRPVESAGFAKLINGKLEYQFSWNGDRQVMNGPTALKHRLLSSLGWKVVHLPFWEWSKLACAKQEEDYCKSLLERARR
jgi:RAP domain